MYVLFKLSCAALLVMTAGPAAAAPSPEWSHAGYDAEDSFYNPAESTINAGTIGRLTQRWSVNLRQQEASCSHPSAPLVTAGSVIATDARGIASYQVKTGRLAWTFDWEDPGDSTTPSMAISDGVLILGNGGCNSASDPDGALTALDASTGKVRWRLEPPVPVNSFVVDKGVVAVSGGSESDETMTVAYRAQDGRELWRKVGVESSSASSAGRILVKTDRATSAVSLTTGATLWTKPRSWYAESATPTRFLTTDGTALSLVEAASGTPLWVAPGQQSELLATDGRRAYRAVARTVSALDLRDGRPLWTRTIPTNATQPIRAGGLLYTGGSILSAATGAVVNGKFPGHQIIVGGQLFVSSERKLTTYGLR